MSTTFILGAGATRGCSFVYEEKRLGRCIPPLDADFFTQLQRVSNEIHRPRIQKLIEGLVHWFGPNYTLGMEQVFCHLEQAERMLGHLQKEAGADYREVVNLRRDLVQSIAIILGESLTPVTDGAGSYMLRPCKWHDKIVGDLAEAGDSFITFNYDCVIDDSLRRMGSGKWNPHHGYGFKLGHRGKKLDGDQHWSPTDAPLVGKDETIKVHKVHGSLHFHVREKGQVKLKQRPYGNPRAGSGEMNFTIIPPESSKTYDDGVFGDIMRGAHHSLRASNRVVIIGYSLPPSDQHAEALFRFGIKRGALDSLVIVNPDKTARRRIRTAAQGGLKSTTRVLSFDYLEEFANADPRIWRV